MDIDILIKNAEMADKFKKLEPQFAEVAQAATVCEEISQRIAKHELTRKEIDAAVEAHMERDLDVVPQLNRLRFWYREYALLACDYSRALARLSKSATDFGDRIAVEVLEES